MTKIQKKQLMSLEIGDWNLFGIWNLVIGISSKDAHA